MLLKEGAKITVWDPVGLNKLKKIFGKKIQYELNLDKAISKNGIIFIMTEWPEIVKIDLEKLSNKQVYDGRNCFPLKEVQKYNIKYYSIGRNVKTDIFQ